MAIKSKAKTKAEKIAKTPFEVFGRMSQAGLQKTLKTLRTGYMRRVGSFKRKGLVSHAEIAFESSYNNTKPIKEMSRNQLLYSIAQYAKFFNDITSSESGIKQVNREQDARIFGVNKFGRPKKTLTAKERESYWKLYEQFISNEPTATSKYGSENVQRLLADAVIGDDRTFQQIAESDFFAEYMDYLGSKIMEKAEEKVPEDTPNVYSGGRNTK